MFWASEDCLFFSFIGLESWMSSGLNKLAKKEANTRHTSEAALSQKYARMMINIPDIQIKTFVSSLHLKYMSYSKVHAFKINIFKSAFGPNGEKNEHHTCFLHTRPL